MIFRAPDGRIKRGSIGLRAAVGQGGVVQVATVEADQLPGVRAVNE